MNQNYVTIERMFDAPVEKVWQLWSTPEGIMKWWGPAIFTSPECKMDFREGGSYVFCMQDASGNKSYSGGTYKEIEPMQKIVSTDHFTDKDGSRVPASTYGLPDEDFPDEFTVTVLFEDMGGKTKLTLTHGEVPGERMRELMRQGWNEQFDKLQADATGKPN
jgi:uncharacterized protein YndB with AHSA1/START domain